MTQRVDVPALAKEFEARMSRLALEIYQREIAAGYPLLRTMRGASAVVELFERRSREQQQRLAELMVRKQTVNIEAMPEDDRKVLRAFIVEWGHHDPDSDPKYRPPRLARAKLARAVDEALRPLFGEPERCGSGRLSRLRQYAWGHAGWRVETIINLTERRSPLIYSHHVSAPDGNHLPLGALSMLTAMGLRSEWSDFGDADIPAVVASLERFCTTFLGAFPALISGLIPGHPR